MRKRYAVLAGVVALAVAGYVGFWFWMAEAVETGVLRWAEARRASGAEVGWRGLRIGGFPFRLRLEFTEPHIALPARALAPQWRGARLVALAHPWNLRHWLASFEGEQAFAFAEDGALRRIAVAAERWRASWRMDAEGRPTRVSFDMRGVAAHDSAAPGPIRATRLQLHARPGGRPEALVDVALKAEGLELPEAAEAPLGPLIALAELDATVVGPLAPGDYPEIVLDWRDAGGVVEVRRAALDWGEVRFEATGTLALDAATRLEGAFTAKVWNHGRLIDALVATGAVAADDAQLVRAALDVLAAAGGGVLAAPVTLQNGKIWLGPAAVARLRPLLPDAARNPAPASPARPQ